MTAKMGIREITRNISELDKYDYIEIEDKKTHKIKGLFVSQKYADELKDFLEKKIDKEKKERIEKIMQFAGTFEIDDRFKGLEGIELKTEIAKAKCGM